MNVSIETIPHQNQRYDTVGDWAFAADGTLEINVSDLTGLSIVEYVKGSAGVIRPVKNEDSVFLVAIHELVEAYLCKRDGITTAQVDNFDMNFKGEGEPGDAADCPYAHQHFVATAIEHFLCGAMGIKWAYHERICDAVQHNNSPKS